MKRLARIKYNLYGESKDYQTDVIYKDTTLDVALNELNDLLS